MPAVLAAIWGFLGPIVGLLGQAVLFLLQVALHLIIWLLGVFFKNFTRAIWLVLCLVVLVAIHNGHSLEKVIPLVFGIAILFAGYTFARWFLK